MQEIKYIAIEKLKAHPQNPRSINEKQMEILCDSIKANKEFFETRPILCNKNHVVFAGNMRLLAAQKIGLTEVPCAVMDISEERQREIMIRDNVSNGAWDFDLLGNNFDVPELISWGMPENQLVGDSGEPVEEGGCTRCAELKQMLSGHENRSGHKVMESQRDQEGE